MEIRGVGVTFCDHRTSPTVEHNKVEVNHILTQLHWLKVFGLLECMKFKLAVLVYRSLHQTVPLYLAEEFHEARQRLLSASTPLLAVCLSTIGNRAFPVAAARLWNILSRNITSASSIYVFRKV